MKLSVIICTHHPRPDYLARTLEALRRQTLPTRDWELILIDNASQPALAAESFGPGVAWHPAGRLVREEELGLTVARLRGIAEAQTELVVMVDDDNVLDPDYLENALRIHDEHPHIGVWGSARLVPEFEVQPDPRLAPWVAALALWELPHDVWSNLRHPNRSVPCGAGMCIRKPIARHWSDLVANDPIRRGLDRKGQSLVSAGDGDLALTACSLGLGTGVFTALRLTHLIPARRVHRDYLLNLFESMQFSEALLRHVHGVSDDSFRERCKQTARLFFLRGVHRRFHWRSVRGIARARRMIRGQAVGSPASNE